PAQEAAAPRHYQPHGHPSLLAGSARPRSSGSGQPLVRRPHSQVRNTEWPSRRPLAAPMKPTLSTEAAAGQIPNPGAEYTERNHDAWQFDYVRSKCGRRAVFAVPADQVAVRRLQLGRVGMAVSVDLPARARELAALSGAPGSDGL